MATPGQAVSTGQGRGEAQVFQPLKNDYYKNKANLALKEKEAMKKAQLEIGSAPIWNRDLGLFNEKRQKIQTFARENQRALLEGDFDKQLEFEQLKADTLQFANSSNTKMKEWQTTDKMIKSNPNKYYGKSVDEHNAFAEDAGNFGNYGVRERFDPEVMLKSLGAQVSSLDPVYSPLHQVDADGKKMVVNEARVRDEDVRSSIASGLDAFRNQYGDQVDEWIKSSGTDVYEALKGRAKQSRSATQVNDYKNSAAGQKAVKAAQRRKQLLYNIMKNVPGSADEEFGHFIGKYNSALKGTVLDVSHETAGRSAGTIVVKLKDKQGNEFTEEFNTQDPKAFSSINSFVSGLSGMENLDDNDLSLVPDYKGTEPQKPAAKTGELEDSLLKVLSNPDLDDLARKDLNALADSLTDLELAAKVREFNKDPDGLVDYLGTVLKGRTAANGKKIKSMSFDTVVNGPDAYDIIYEDGTEENILSSDETAVRNLLTLAVSESDKKSVTSKSGQTQESKDKKALEVTDKAKALEEKLKLTTTELNSFKTMLKNAKIKNPKKSESVLKYGILKHIESKR